MIDPVTIGAVASFAGGLLGGGKSNNNAWNERQTHLAREWEQYKWNEDYRRQKEFANMGIRWKVRDAKKAGLHPLAVLGSSGASYSGSPATVGAAADSQQYGGNPMGDALSAMGQNLARAETATKTDAERELEALSLTNMRLRNRALEAEITQRYASIMGQPGNPPMPSAVGPGSVVVEPSRVTASRRGEASVTAGTPPLTTEFAMGGGARIQLPSQAAAESLETMGPFAAPFVNGISALRRWWHGPDDPPNLRLPPGYRWEWSVGAQAFRPVAPPAVQRREAIDQFRNYRPGRGTAPTR